MLTGIIKRRIADRAPFQGGIKIKFVNSDGTDLLSAFATNISAGGMRFAIPQNSLLINPGDQLSFIFQLPDSGAITVLAEVRNCDCQSGDSGSEVHYGVKFLDLSLEDWNAILAYCNLNRTVEPQPEHNPPESVATTCLLRIPATLQIADGLNLSAEIEDLSFGGARVNLGQPLPINSLVTLVFNFDGVALVLHGYCVWSGSDKNNTGQYLAGIFFNQLEQREFEQLKMILNHK